ncbi:GNAT family N-acetyltransferase [Pelomonas sp. SE-A7]|uniref:GNAT family N-acetyltransferase n=1 Tax=Pelomonas sp. SE-A7 TaxID=3054953 RepID=UPI00259D0903|nr:GNAT family N-acetyltransferase [Pelomonas sp. SE-A7]MDM4768477.1 GNAT family N-acetyltransferase [Pelomonas sp. SE-A7]
MSAADNRRWQLGLPAEDAARVAEGEHGYRQAQSAGGRPQAFSLGLYEGEDLIAGLTGHTEFHRLFIDQVWVEDDWRGGGLGTGLLRRAEAEALRLGCVDALVETLSDRTAEWFESLGFTCVAHVHDYLPGFTRHILIKVWKPRG